MLTQAILIEICCEIITIKGNRNQYVLAILIQNSYIRRQRRQRTACKIKLVLATYQCYQQQPPRIFFILQFLSVNYKGSSMHYCVLWLYFTSIANAMQKRSPPNPCKVLITIPRSFCLSAHDW
jgi:hypothetical protein